MPDHGLFVTGIVRDVAPGATIEFVRVLDDYGVGSTDTVVSALNAIQTRIGSGDLKGQPVVINLSLLVSPPDDVLPTLWFGNNATFNANQVNRANYDLTLLNAPLHTVIKSLTSTGAVVVAAAGNESNTPDIPRRLGPAYPAAYAEVIAVGAVDSQGAAAAYSNYPQSLTQPYGIATYGGALLPLDALTNHQDIDAVRGLYSSESYAPLDSQNTGSLPQPPQPNSHWAYWSGTSFAAPIISAVAARALQLKAGSIDAHLWANEMQYLLTTAQGQQELFGHMLTPQPDLGVSLLVARQGCQPAHAQPVAATPHHETSSIS
jgi:subtilisin family serine protease